MTLVKLLVKALGILRHRTKESNMTLNAHYLIDTPLSFTFLRLMPEKFLSARKNLKVASLSSAKYKSAKILSLPSQ